jgi:hypothetical protein
MQQRDAGPPGPASLFLLPTDEDPPNVNPRTMAHMTIGGDGDDDDDNDDDRGKGGRGDDDWRRLIAR